MGAQARDGEGESTPSDILNMVKQQAAPGHRRERRFVPESHAPLAFLWTILHAGGSRLALLYILTPAERPCAK